MKNKFYILLLSFLFSQTIYAKKLQEITSIVQGSKIKAYRYILENKMQIIIVPDNRNPVATLHFILDAGSDREKLGSTGLAHFFEHNMFRKVLDAPEGNYDRVLNSVGGSGNAQTSDSFVHFYTTFPAPALESILAIEADRFQKLDIKEPYFSIEKQAVLSERKLRLENSPIERATEILRSLTERNTPMQWMTIGAKNDIEGMNISTAQKFYHDFYMPNNTLMILGGPFEPENAYKLIKKYFSAWKERPLQPHYSYPVDYFIRDNGKEFICSADISTKRYEIIYPSAISNLYTLAYSMIFLAMLDNSIDGTFLRQLVKLQLATDFNFYQNYWQNYNKSYRVEFALNQKQDFAKVKDYWLKSIRKISNLPLTFKIKKQVLTQLAVENAHTSEKMSLLVDVILNNSFFLHDFYAAGKLEKFILNMTDHQFKTWLHEALNANNFYVTGIVPKDEAISCTTYINSK